MTLLQARHHGLTGDGAKLIGEGAVEDQDVHCEDPLTDGCSVLQDEALMDEEDAALEEGKLRLLSSVKYSRHNIHNYTKGGSFASGCQTWIHDLIKLQYTKILHRHLIHN